LLSGKRKYCTKLFPLKGHYRECKLLVVPPEKIKKYVGEGEARLAEFLEGLMQELSGKADGKGE
jgi:hypothetical protein